MAGDDTERHDERIEYQGATWSKDAPPTPVQVTLVSPDSPTERIRNLEEGQRSHSTQLQEHGRVLDDIRDHLEALVDQFTKLRTAGIIGIVVVFGGTANGEKLVNLLSGLFH
jgi:hypothetical protein